jgi:hypothetical protein
VETSVGRLLEIAEDLDGYQGGFLKIHNHNSHGIKDFDFGI